MNLISKELLQAKNEPLKVDLEMANGQLFDHEGIVETIEGEFDNETGNIAFRATFNNPDRLLRHGETGNVIVKNPYKNAILIPQKATFEVLDKKFVFVVDKNGLKSWDNPINEMLKSATMEIPNCEFSVLITSGIKWQNFNRKNELNNFNLLIVINFGNNKLVFSNFS